MFIIIHLNGIYDKKLHDQRNFSRTQNSFRGDYSIYFKLFKIFTIYKVKSKDRTDGSKSKLDTYLYYVAL